MLCSFKDPVKPNGHTQANETSLSQAEVSFPRELNVRWLGYTASQLVSLQSSKICYINPWIGSSIRPKQVLQQLTKNISMALNGGGGGGGAKTSPPPPRNINHLIYKNPLRIHKYGFMK